jgi:RNA-splicing ligase RtcB
MAANQLGTVGSGNHYVDIFHDELDRVWIGVHFGSRGLGHKTATWFLNAAGAKEGMDVEPCVLSVKSNLGSQYIKAMTLAGKYAYAGRDWVCARVARLIGHPRRSSQPPQLCMARRARPPATVGCPQGRDSCVPWPEGVCRRLHG